MKEKGLLKVSVVGTKTNVGSVSLVVRHLNLGNTIKRFVGLCPTPNHFLGIRICAHFTLPCLVSIVRASAIANCFPWKFDIRVIKNMVYRK